MLGPMRRRGYDEALGQYAQAIQSPRSFEATAPGFDVAWGPGFDEAFSGVDPETLRRRTRMQNMIHQRQGQAGIFQSIFGA